MKFSSTLKLVKYTLAILITAKLYNYVTKLLKVWNRAKELALALPSVPRLKGKENSLDFLGAVVRHFPNQKFTPEATAKYLVSAQIKNFKEHGNGEGLLCNWGFNPKYTLKPFASVHLFDVELARELLSTKNLDKIQKGKAYEVSNQLIGQGVLTTSGDVWHRQRIIIERGFTEKLIRQQFPMVVQTSNDLIERLKKLHARSLTGTQSLSTDGFVKVNVIEEMLKATMDVLGRVAFSYEIGSLKCENTKDAVLFSSFEIILHTLHVRMYDLFKSLTRSWFPSQENYEFNQSLNNLNKVITEIIQKRKQQGISKDPKDLLDILLQGTKDSKGNKLELTSTEVLDNMRTILFAGHDTTAAALTWSFYLLAKHPQTIERILEEFKKNNFNLSVECLEQSNYLNAVVLEVLRLYPSAGFTRSTKEEIKLGKYLLPKGIDILILPYFLHRLDKNIENPDAFIPERWLDMDNEKNLGLQATLAKATRTNTYLPFSLGKRNCVGRKLALLEVRVVLLQILLKFDIQLPKKQEKDFQEVPYLGLTLYPKDVYLEFKPKR